MGARAAAARSKHEILGLRAASTAGCSGRSRPRIGRAIARRSGRSRAVSGSSSAISSCSMPRSGMRSVAAVVVEPVQGEGGVRVFDAEFLRALRALTQRAPGRAHLRRDPVRTGTHRMIVRRTSRAGVMPDLITLAKPLARRASHRGGVDEPPRSPRRYSQGDHGSTFGGGPFVASIARHVVQRLADPALLAAGARPRRMARPDAGSADRPCARRARGPRHRSRFGGSTCGSRQRR